MSDRDALPRVVIRKGAKGASLSFNFSHSVSGISEADRSVKALLELANDWTSYCIASLQFVPKMSHVGFFMAERAIDKEVVKFLNEVSISKEEFEDAVSGEAVLSFILHEEDLNQVAIKMATTTQMIRAADAVKRSTLGSLIAEFDFFLVRLLGICAQHLPDKFYDPTEKVTLGELISATSLDEIVKKKIANTLARKLHESHADVIDWIFGTLDISQSKSDYKKDPVFIDFLEVCQRRHILTHNGGIVNSDYHDKCLRAGVRAADLPRIGDRVEISSQYIKRSTARVYLTGYYILHLFLQKHFPNERKAAFSNLLSTSHAFLENDLTKMCERICDFAERSSKYFDHDLRLKFGVNRALAKLYSPEKNAALQQAEAEAVLAKYDWSVTTPIFDLVLSCIRREFPNILEKARLANAAGLGYNEARTFVVFREARNIDGFLECFPRSPLLLA